MTHEEETNRKRKRKRERKRERKSKSVCVCVCGVATISSFPIDGVGADLEVDHAIRRAA
jgi:hypothetical protein